MKRDKERRDQLIAEYQPYVRSVVRRLEKQMGLPAENRDEYLAAGYLGLVEAAGRFDPSLGKPFQSYAFLRIRGAIIDSIRLNSDLPAYAYQQLQAAKAAQELREEDQRKYETRPFPPEREKRLAELFSYVAKCGLAYRLCVDEVESKLLSESADPEKMVGDRSFARRLRELVEELPDKEKLVVSEYYFADRSFAEISDCHDSLSRSWVSRIHSKALERLKFKLVRNEI